MIPLSALPWDTIGIVIGLALLIPSLIAITGIKLKRFEEVGWSIGLFLILLSILTYSWIIPITVVDEATLPADYIWEDEGEIYYWEKNSIIAPHESNIKLPDRLAERFHKRDPIERTFIGQEIITVSSLDQKNNQAIIQDVLLDENGDVFTVINNNELIAEWYTVNPHLNNLQYSNLNAGSMAIPAQTTTTTYPVGWVESGGSPDGEEHLVLLRSMKNTKTATIDGITFSMWESTIYNQPITWHGEPYICDETLRLIVEPETGYIIHVYRNLVLSAHLSQFVQLYYPQAMDNKLVTRFLGWNDPIGEAAILRYETTPASQAQHIENVKSLNNQLDYYPLLICIPLLILGLLLLWRYAGRSYYWKKFKEFER